MSWMLQPAREAFPAFAAEWDRLNREFYRDHPFFDSRFVGPLIECFGSGNELLCIHKASEKVNGALILCPHGFGRWALFQPSQAQIGAVLLRNGTLLETLFATLPGFAVSIDLLALDPLFSPEWHRLSLPRITTAHALTMTVETNCAFEDYWQKRPKQLRKNLRRYQHRARSHFSSICFTATTDPTLVEAAVARYGEVETAGWKGKVGTAIHADNVQGKFYTLVLRNFARTDQARVLELNVDNRLAASRLQIRNDDMEIILKTTFDESMGNVAPGRQHLYETLRQAFTDPRPRSVEFYTNATREQAEWASSFRYIRHQQILRNKVVAAAYQLLAISKRKLLPGVDSRQASAIKFPASSVQGCRAIADVPGDARDLLAATARDNVECSPGWFANLEQAVFTNETGVCYYVARISKQCQLVLPVRLTQDRWIRQIEALGNFYTSLYAPALSETATALDLANALQDAARDHNGPHVMRFSPMDPKSPAYEMLLTAIRSIGWIPFRYFCFGNWYLKVETGWQDYLIQRDSKLRNTIKRKGKKFAAAGGTLGITTGGVELELGIDAYNTVYAASWKKPEPYLEFIPGLIRWLATQGRLRLGIARLHGQPIAAQIWIVNDGKASIFKLAYDERYAHLGAGTLLTAHLMEHVIDDDKVREVDYLVGDDEHKKLWMSDRRERWGVVAYNPVTAIGLCLLIKELAGRLIRKATPVVPHTQTTCLGWELHPISHFDDQAARWDTLQQECMNLPFLESAFLKPLLVEFGTGRELLAFGYRDSKLCAAAILTKKRFGTWQTFQPSQLPLGAWVSNIDGNLAELGKSLLRALPGFNLDVSLTQIDSMFQPRPEDEPCIRTMDYIDTAWVDIDQPFESYWEARGKNLKTNVRKQRTKLQTDDVKLALECVTTPEGVAEAIEHYGALEMSGWKGTDGTAVHPDNAQGRFYRQMLENFCAYGRGRIFRYRFNDKVVAMDLCIEMGDRLVILKTAYDETFKTISPSTLMRQDEFRELFEIGRLKRIEFYGKVMEWHTRWTDNKRRLYHLTTYRWTPLQWLHAQYQTYRSNNVNA